MTELFTRLRKTDVQAWPVPVQALAWQLPRFSLPLDTDPDTGALSIAETCPDAAPADLFPKLALKSWQESGRLRLIPKDQPLAAAVAARLATPTAQQRMILRAWLDADSAPHLHLFDWRDMMAVSEIRYLWTGGSMRYTSLCQRNTAPLDGNQFGRAAATIAETMPDLGDFVVQFAIPHNGQARIIDINPAVTAEDIDTLKGAAA